ncbi:MAG: NAD(P)-dependent glycerol-3-phosphate dehydrogenase [Bacteriovoracaceae bacterium]|nr:NAD(P)-dependent glycerol-3-phosphate dehydrogenase [Bacteriovoracaceae bacterium]
MKFETACVIGAGSFGTSIASVLSNNFKKVILKVRHQEVYADLLKGENKRYLLGHKLSSNIVPAMSFDEVEEKKEGPIDLLVCALPTATIEAYLKKNEEYLLTYLQAGIPFVSLAKGIDPLRMCLSDELYLSVLKKYEKQMCYLSGPSFAQEIVEEQITLVSLAGEDKDILQKAASMFRTNYFKTIPTEDVKGVLLGGALKNVLAIAAGIIEGLGYSHNTRAALLTKGIEEMLLLGTTFGAKKETFYGLSGIGDLILTTTGGLSRNYNFGIEIGKGKSANALLKEMRGVVEGYRTTEAVYNISQKYALETRIFHGVYEVLYKDKSPKIAISQLLKLIPKF